MLVRPGATKAPAPLPRPQRAFPLQPPQQRPLAGRNQLRRYLVAALIDPNDPWQVIDSFPLVVARDEAGFGRAYAKAMPFFGFRVHLLLTLEGIVADFVLAPANTFDGTLASEVLAGCRGYWEMEPMTSVPR